MCCPVICDQRSEHSHLQFGSESFAAKLLLENLSRSDPVGIRVVQEAEIFIPQLILRQVVFQRCYLCFKFGDLDRQFLCLHLLRVLRFLEQALRGNPELLMQCSHHSNRQGALTTQDFGHSRARAQDCLKMLTGESQLLQAKPDGLDRIGRRHRMMGPLIVGYQECEKLQAVILPGSGRGLKQPLNFMQRRCQILLAAQRPADVPGWFCSRSHTVAASTLSYSAWVPTNRTYTTLASYRIATMRRYLLPPMFKTTRLSPRKLALAYLALISAGPAQSLVEASEYQARSGCSASPCSVQNSRRVLRAMTLTALRIPCSQNGSKV